MAAMTGKTENALRLQKRKAMQLRVQPSMFESEYGNVFESNADWNQLPTPEGDLYDWDHHST